MQKLVLQELPGREAAPRDSSYVREENFAWVNKPLIIFEIANNHEGSVDHGKKIIHGLAQCKRPYESLFDFAVKFQFRNIDTFVDPQADSKTNKHIARFRANQLTESQWADLTLEARANGFVVITTPFDEASIERAVRLQITVLKIASCSAQEWPLIQKAAAVAQQLIVSTAGLKLDQIDALYSYLRHECRGRFTILHCIGLYPTPLEHLNLATIRRFIQRYPKARIGYSGHERPADHHVSATALAIGAEVFERHVGLLTDKTPLNAYSLDMPDVASWLKAMSETTRMLGTAKTADYLNQDENCSLAALRRGVFARTDIEPNSEITPDVVQFRFPLRNHQVDVSDFATIYHRFFATQRIQAGEPITLNNSKIVVNSHSRNIDRYVQRIRGIATEANIDIPDGELLEISHHFGVEELWSYGCCIVNVLNRSYCKKLILMAAGQEHPEQFHKVKEETFRILNGTLQLAIDNTVRVLHEGDTMLIPIHAKHAFKALTDVVIEELSTTSSPEDSYYTDARISSRPRTSRKSMVRNFIRSE